MNGILKLNRAYGRFLYLCGLISGTACFVMMLLVTLNVAGRYFFNSPIPGAFEITESVLTLMVFFAFALTQHNGGNLRVSVLTQNLSPPVRRGLSALMRALGALLFGVAAYVTWDFAMESFEVNEQEWSAIQFPIWPVKFIVFAGLVLLAIQYVLDTLRVLGGEDPDADDQAPAAERRDVTEADTWTS